MKINYIFDSGSSMEDLYLIKDNIFAVFDGFKSLDKFLDGGGRTGGLIAATIAKDTFSQTERDLKNLVMETNQKIRQKMMDLCTDTTNKNSLWGLVLSAARIKNNSFEWAQIGDSLILVIYKNNTYKLLVEDYDHDKKILQTWRKLANQKKENIREIINPALAKLRGKMNKTYGALNGDKKAISFLREGEEKLQNIRHILIFTDGLIIPKENPMGNDDWNLFVKLFLEGGIKKIKKFVRNLQEGDPKCWKYPRYKQYDDITAISISF